MNATTGLNLPNKNSNFFPVGEGWELRYYPIKESVAIEEGTALSPEISSNNVTGKLTKMGVENATGSDFVGILAEAIRSTDDDYATSLKLKGVYVPVSARAQAEFTVGAGTFTTADVFKTVELHSDSKSLAVDTLGKGAMITGYISSSRGICEFTMPKTEVA